MTKERATEVIGLFALTYPYAEIFKAADAEDLKRKQAALIGVWTAALPDLEDWVAVLAANLCLRRCKYMPTVAEFKEAAEEIQRKFENEAHEAFIRARDAVACFPGKEEKMMGPRAWTVIQAMGGLDAFAPIGKSYDMYRFQETYMAMLRKMPETLPAKKLRELVGRK